MVAKFYLSESFFDSFIPLNNRWGSNDAILQSKFLDLFEVSIVALGKMDFDLAASILRVARKFVVYLNIQYDVEILDEPSALLRILKEKANLRSVSDRTERTQYILFDSEHESKSMKRREKEIKIRYTDYSENGRTYRVPVSEKKGHFIWNLIDDDTIKAIIVSRIQERRITSRTELLRTSPFGQVLYSEARKRGLLDDIIPDRKNEPVFDYIDYEEHGETYRIPVYGVAKRWLWKQIDTETIRKLLKCRVKVGAKYGTTRTDIIRCTPKGGLLIQEAKQRGILDEILPAISR
jgi:hypothetical protein